ncbi:cell division protein SepF [Staphylococcus ratti]|uniref:Cell division protein SepF n=1 Tax=Staphylococcus ratti TaxID=2892440 RepID=A0ABY3PAS7_9STAP|nr:cell division protein SepF [Staphylococcus ratti]UEX89396.1 cell division protein SepF [Staphylococcus ratti]
MAIKDLFNGFFTFEEEDDDFIEEEERRERAREREMQREADKNQSASSKQGFTQSTQTTERPRALQSVPKKQSSRNKSTHNERKYQIAKESATQQGNVVSMTQTQDAFTNGSSKMCLFEPRVFSDTQDIADELKNRRATLVNLQQIDAVSAKRIIDFLSGTVYAIGGDIQRVGADIFLCTPDNVEVAGSISEHIDAMENQYE